jgi:hypothetical protein
MIEIEHTAYSRAPRAHVWSMLAALDRWNEWGPWSETKLDGDIRTMVADRKRLNGKPYVMKEHVTALVPEERFEYDLLSGLPVKNYHGTVTLRDGRDGGTEIHWQSRFNGPWPIFKGLWRGAMLKVITEVSERLARASTA